MSRHNVFYVGACSFDNPLGGSYRERTLTNKNLGRSLHCQKQEHLLNSSFYPQPLQKTVSHFNCKRRLSFSLPSYCSPGVH